MITVAVVQPVLMGDSARDAAGVLEACRAAASHGVNLGVVPEVDSLLVEGGDRAELVEALDELSGVWLLPRFEGSSLGMASIVRAPGTLDGLNTLALMIGDACFDEEQLAGLAAADPDIAIMMPRSESELQAEAALEVAIALSDSLAGVVIVSEPYGAELGVPGHGGSAIIRLGEIVLEASDGPDLLIAAVDTPIARPEPKEPLPAIPPILSQRVATHRGVRPSVGYPADLSDGLPPG